MIFPPVSFIFWVADFEAEATVTVIGFVIFPVPRSLVYPRLVRFMVSSPCARVSSSSLARFMTFSLWWSAWGEWNPCLPK